MKLRDFIKKQEAAKGIKVRITTPGHGGRGGSARTIYETEKKNAGPSDPAQK